MARVIDLAKTIIPFALVFGAIALVTALALSRSCSVGIGRRVARPADPYRYPFGDPTVVKFPSGSILDRDFASIDEAGRRHRAF